ncbi:MAG TPA: serine hydrolase [Cytophagaceae bacterium]|nr:serine hydrolase [Cytophagaceae bacterium]
MILYKMHSAVHKNGLRWIAVLLLVINLAGCMPYQAYLYIVPDEKDIHRFKKKNVLVKNALQCSNQAFNFPQRTNNKPIYVSNWDPNEPLEKAALEEFLEDRKAKHFLVIKNDSIVFEYNNKEIKENEPTPGFSIAKALVSATVGVALKEGYIGSVNDHVKDYIPELNYHPYFDQLTINHLLNQTSGLRMEVDNIAYAYYGKMEHMLKMMHFDARPGEHLEYININTILVGIILERTTGRKLHEYFSEKIWSKIGTCDSTVWAYDYQTNHTRSFSCFGASARDYAKFGKLYLNKGKWGNEQVIDSNWVIASTSPVNALGENVGYNNNWFVGEKEVGDYLAMGMYRQQIYVNPKENVVIVSLMKFNKKNLPLRWWQVLRQVAEQAGKEVPDKVSETKVYGFKE